ncbi:MAG: S41 family peptidase [Pseudomonadota bacterium]
MRKPDFAFWTFLLMAGLAGITTVLNVSQTYSANSPNSAIYRQLDLFGDVLERVRSDYVQKPNDEKLIETAIRGMLKGLDPHSDYMTPKGYEEMQTQTRGKFGGLGIEVTMEKGIVTVVAPIDGTPASKAGLLAGDKITHLDGSDITNLSLSQAVEKMRGAPGTDLVLTVLRKGAKAPLSVKLTRAIISIRAVRSRVEDDVAYIKISTFNEQTHASLVEQVEKLRKQIGPKLKGYIIDLRNNPGGLLDQAVAVSDAFLNQGAIVITKGRNADQRIKRHARKGDITNGKPIVVLVNGGSASASEIVAGALQDHKRAKIFGTRSFGKGSVQTIIPLGNNGAIRLTTAKYYTPFDREIQALGIKPDVNVEQKLPPELQAQRDRFRSRGEASLPGHLKGSGKEETGSSSYVPRDPKKDAQLIYALRVLRGQDKAAQAKPKAPAPKPATPAKPKAKESAN